MQQPCVHNPIDFDTLYSTYWKRVVRFCATCLPTCPDGTAEEVAQDVFLAVHRAIAEQRYRGEGSISAWLFGIARNLCYKTHRDLYRRTIPLSLRQLERDITRLEDDVTYMMHENSSRVRDRLWLVRDRLTLARIGLEHERERLQRRVQESVHCTPPASLEAQSLATDTLAVLQHSLQRLARCQRQAYTLLYLHLIQGVSMRDVAQRQGVSRSTVHRNLTQAKATLRQVYASTWDADMSEEGTQGAGSWAISQS
jgi:RNA polymerase sigma factor (sigma-70 family)